LAQAQVLAVDSDGCQLPPVISRMNSLRLWLFCVGPAVAVALDTFKVAELKPHYGCKGDDGQDRVRKYIANLVTEGTGLISLIELEFDLPQPSGYTAFGASCGHYTDPVVVLVNEAQFTIVSTIGQTVTGNYSALPYVGGGHSSNATSNTMCVSDPHGAIYADGKNWTMGSRSYTGAVLSHKASGKEICVVSGTFAHCLYKWTDQFVADIEKGCGDRQLLIVADTNAGCEIPTLTSESHWSMNEILANHSQAAWGPCHDPGLYTAPTCCNDLPDFPYPRLWYDRTAVCRGGRVEDFKVETSFVCADSPEEHLFTSATVHLAEADNVESPYCLDHPACAKIGLPHSPYTDNYSLPTDGLCCPTSASNTRLSCCGAVALV